MNSVTRFISIFPPPHLVIHHKNHLSICIHTHADSCSHTSPVKKKNVCTRNHKLTQSLFEEIFSYHYLESLLIITFYLACLIRKKKTKTEKWQFASLCGAYSLARSSYQATNGERQIIVFTPKFLNNTLYL